MYTLTVQLVTYGNKGPSNVLQMEDETMALLTCGFIRRTCIIFVFIGLKMTQVLSENTFMLELARALYIPQTPADRLTAHTH